MPVSSQATSSQSTMALLTGTRASAGRNDLKSPRNVGAVLRVKRSGAVFDVDLSSPAVELDLVNPLWSGRRDFRQRRSHRLNEGNFTQHAADVGRRARLYNAAIPSARRNPAAIPANRGK